VSNGDTNERTALRKSKCPFERRKSPCARDGCCELNQSFFAKVPYDALAQLLIIDPVGLELRKPADIL
jgi:hypothetical protein